MPFFTPGKRGTIRENPQMNAEEAAIKLRNAMEGMGSDERIITDVILAYSNKQRQEIRQMYTYMYDRDLMRQLESELTFHYEKIVCALMLQPEDVIIDCINEAVTLGLGEGLMKKFQKVTYKKGIAADEYTLMGLLIPRKNRELVELKKAYKSKYKKDLEKQIANSPNLSLDFRRLIIAMIDGKREEREVDQGDRVLKDVMTLIGAKKEDSFHVVMHERSYPHLLKLFDAYKDLTGKQIEDLVENSKFGLDLKESYIALLTLLKTPAVYFATMLRNAISGAGTDDDVLIQVMVLRSEVDLVDILRAYEDKFETSLVRDIQGDTSGDYEDILSKMCRIPEVVLIEEAQERQAKIDAGEIVESEDEEEENE